MLEQINEILLPIYLFLLYLGLWTFITCTEHLNSQNSPNTDVPNLIAIDSGKPTPKDYSIFSLIEIKQMAIDLNLKIPKKFDRRYKKNWIALLPI